MGHKRFVHDKYGGNDEVDVSVEDRKTHLKRIPGAEVYIGACLPRYEMRI